MESNLLTIYVIFHTDGYSLFENHQIFCTNIMKFENTRRKLFQFHQIIQIYFNLLHIDLEFAGEKVTLIISIFLTMAFLQTLIADIVPKSEKPPHICWKIYISLNFTDSINSIRILY